MIILIYSKIKNLVFNYYNNPKFKVKFYLNSMTYNLIL